MKKNYVTPVVNNFRYKAYETILTDSPVSFNDEWNLVDDHFKDDLF